MAPIHHHFEKKGWAESTIVIRFWIIAIILSFSWISNIKITLNNVLYFKTQRTIVPCLWLGLSGQSVVNFLKKIK